MLCLRPLILLALAGAAIGCGHGKGARAPADKLAYAEERCAEGVGGACDFAGIKHFEGECYPEALELFESGCRHGAGNACANAAVIWRDGLAGARDAARATELAATGCELDSGRACEIAGTRYERGDGVQKDLKRSVALFERGCQLRSVDACYALGVAYAWGRGVPADQTRAINLYRTACDAGVASACKDLAGRYQSGRGVPRDLEVAETFGRLACDGESPTGCWILSSVRAARGAPHEEVRGLQDKACRLENTLGCQAVLARDDQGLDTQLVEHARQVMAERRDALRLSCDRGIGSACQHLGAQMLSEADTDHRSVLASFERGCELGWRSSCWRVGWYLGAVQPPEVRRIIPLDEARALDFATRGCDGGDSYSCVYRAQLGLGTLPLSQLRAALEKACELDAASCWRVSSWRRHGVGGPAVDAPTDRALERSCDADDHEGCRGLQQAFVKSGAEGLHADVAGYLERLRKRCAADDALACELVMDAEASGWGGAADPAAAIRAAAQRCSEGDAIACGDVGVRFERGSGVERDLERSRQAYERACEVGERALACDNLASWLRRYDRSAEGRTRAMALATEGCRKGRAHACFQLQALLDDGRSPAPDAAAVRTALEAGCATYRNDPCLRLAVARRDGVGGPQDLENARIELREQCVAHGKACAALGLLYERHSALVTFGAPAAEAYSLGCALQDEESCARLQLLRFEGDREQLGAAVNRCLMKHEHCRPLIGSARHPRISEEEGLAALGAACVSGRSCNDVAFVLTRHGYAAEALPFARQSLELEHAQPVRHAPHTLATALLELGRFDEARAVLEEALERTPTDRPCLELLHDVEVYGVAVERSLTRERVHVSTRDAAALERPFAAALRRRGALRETPARLSARPLRAM